MTSSDPAFVNFGPSTFVNGIASVGGGFKTSGNETLTLTDSADASITGSASAFPSPSGVQSNASGTALQVGGGADLTISHLALRLVQAHWVRTWMPNAYTGAQNNVTVGAGIVLRIP